MLLAGEREVPGNFSPAFLKQIGRLICINLLNFYQPLINHAG